MKSITNDIVEELSEQLHFGDNLADPDFLTDQINDGVKRYEELYDERSSRGLNRYSINSLDFNPSVKKDPVNAFTSRFQMSCTDSTEGEIAGTTIAVKDNIAVAGVPMTCGSKVFEGVVPQKNATIVRQLIESGAEIIGKANMDELAFGLTGETSQFNPTLNPVNKSHVPGGSSSGSAAAVAEGLAEAAIGTDTGGSIRNPASLCGLVGFKPSWGVVPRFGMVELAYTTDTIGPITQDVTTSAQLMDVLIGRSPEDSTSDRASDLEQKSFKRSVRNPPSIEDISIGLPKEFFSDEISAEVLSLIEDQIDQIEEAGATVNEVSVPSVKRSIGISKAIYYTEFASFFLSLGLPTRRKVTTDTTYQHAMANAILSSGRQFGKTVQKNAIEGAYILEYLNGHPYALARNGCETLRKEFHTALSDNDILLTPTLPVTAPELGEVSYDEYGKSIPITINTRPVSLAGLPAATVPTGSIDGLPVGIQLIGEEFADSQVLQIARSYEQFQSAQ